MYILPLIMSICSDITIIVGLGYQQGSLMLWYPSLHAYLCVPMCVPYMFLIRKTTIFLARTINHLFDI